MSIDPVLGWSLRGALALMFAAAAVHKLRAPRDFRITLADYGLVPDVALGPIARGLPAGELALAVGLLLPAVASSAGWVAAALLSVYGLAMGINLARGRRHLSCGCLGPAADEPVHGGLLVRNGVLSGAALCAALPLTTRPWAWLDGVTLVAAIATLGLLYVAAEGLLATSRRMAAS